MAVASADHMDQHVPTAFISYSNKDKPMADTLCRMLEAKGIRVWYAPRNVLGDYATAIVQAISDCDYFVCILSKNSIHSEHVLNEVDLAFQEMKRNLKLKLIKIDDEPMTPAFRYYLSRQHHMDACRPPIDQRLEEFVSEFDADL